jgi:hypothetical protein
VLSSSSLSSIHRPATLSQATPRCTSRQFSSSFCKAAVAATAPKPASTTPKYTPKPSTSSITSKSPSIDDQSSISDITSSGLADEPIILDEGSRQVDWTRSFHGLSAQPFSKEAADILLAPIEFDEIEVKPDGLLYLPEIKYRRILNKAFGPGGWGLAPRGETIVTSKSITREYALVAHGR